MGEQKVKKVSEEDVLKEAEKELKILEKAKGKAVGETKEQKNKETKKQGNKEIRKQGNKETKEQGNKETREQENKKKIKQPKIRSKKYQKTKALVNKSKLYSIDEAIELAKKTSYAKFDASLEIHIKLARKKSSKAKRAEYIRGLIELPHKTGKKVNIGILDENLIEKIKKEKTTSYKILLATPEIMPKVAKLAKILGPKGLMPNPKSGTVTTDPKAEIDKIESGRIEYKSDKNGIVHIMIGKVSFDTQKLVDNYKTIVGKISPNGSKLQSVYICSTMGPSIKIAI